MESRAPAFALLAALLLAIPRPNLAAPAPAENAAVPPVVSPDGGPSSRPGNAAAESPSPAASPVPPAVLREYRNASAALALLDKIDPPLRDPDALPPGLDDLFVSTLDLHLFELPLDASVPCGCDQAYILSATPSSVAAFDSALAAQGWRLQPGTGGDVPQVYLPPDGVDADLLSLCVSRQPSHIAFSTSPGRLAQALAILPFLPPTLPAEGVFAYQKLPRASDHDPIEILDASTLSYGLDLDGGTVVLHAILAPPPGSSFADWLRAMPPIPPETACVNLPGALATLAVAPLPPLPVDFPGGLPREIRDFLSRHPRIPFACAILPPPPADYPDPAVSLLAYAGYPDPAAPLRALDRVTGLPATNAVHRGIPILGRGWNFTVPDNWRFLELLGPVLSCDSPFPLLAPLPTGVLLASDAPPSALSAAIDAALDGNAPTRRFDASPAFPPPDAPPVAILHADLRALAAAYPGHAANFHLDRAVAAAPPSAPLPLDATLHVSPDASLVLRLRVLLSVLAAI